MASTGTAALAAHFRTKRRIFAAPGEETDALVKQAQDELKHAAEEREKVVFRFDFQLNDTAADGAKKKRKNKKKKKKNANINSTAAADINVEEGEEPNPEATHPDADSKAKGEVFACPPSTDDHTGKTAAKKNNKKKNKTSGQDESAAVVEAPASSPPAPAAPPKAAPSGTSPAKREVPPPPGFLKLRKPTSSDSEVMKMQLRYGRGKRNVAAIAQREKQKKATASSGESAQLAPGTDFQFNFF